MFKLKLIQTVCSNQVNDFRNMGYILKRINHSVWFGIGLFHSNNIESLWGQLKRYTNNFLDQL